MDAIGEVADERAAAGFEAQRAGHANIYNPGISQVSLHDHSAYMGGQSFSFFLNDNIS